MAQDNSIVYSASAVSIGGRAVLIEGPSGIGKSELCLTLCDRGAKLVSDDQVLISKTCGSISANPAPNIAGQIEIRNLGIINMEFVQNIPVALIIELSQNAPRFVENARTDHMLGIKVPHIQLTAYSTALAIKVEWALQQYGHPM